MSSASRSRIAFRYSIRLRRWSASVRPGSGSAVKLVERGLEIRHETGARGGVRARQARRRHQVAVKLLDNLLPQLRIAIDVRDVGVVERQAARLQALVVAGDAVGVDESALRGGLLARQSLKGDGGWGTHGAQVDAGTQRDQSDAKQRREQAPSHDCSRHTTQYVLGSQQFSPSSAVTECNHENTKTRKRNWLGFFVSSRLRGCILHVDR